MKETSEEITQLQALLDESVENAGSFLRSSFEMPEHSLSAAQLVSYLQGNQTVAFATVTAKSEPRVAPIGSLFYRGKFYIPTLASAVRTKHVLKRPGVSLTCFAGDGLAIIVHGTATVIAPAHTDFAAVDGLLREYSEMSVLEWGDGDGVYLRVDAKVMYTYARDPVV